MTTMGMSETETQIEQIEVSIEQAKDAIDRMKTLERLRNNDDFIKIIREGYFKEEAIRLVMMKSSHNFQGEQAQKDIIKDIDSIGRLEQYFGAIYQIGHTAQRALEADEETREELLAEELH